MAISHITSAGTTLNATGPATFAITPTGSNSIVWAGGQTYNGAISGATYNGNAMTAVFNYSPTANRYIALFYYANGTADGSAHNVSISYAGSTGGEFVAAAYDGASQTGIPDASNNADAGTGTSASVAVTTVADNCWLFGVCTDTSNNGSQIAGSGTTKRNLQTLFDDFAIYDSNAAKTPAGSYSLATSWTGSATNSLLVASFAPVVVASTAKISTLLLMGV